MMRGTMLGKAITRDQSGDDPTPQELGKHRGEWVAVVGRKVLAFGPDPAAVLKNAMAKTPQQPMIYRVPAGEVMIL